MGGLDAQETEREGQSAGLREDGFPSWTILALGSAFRGGGMVKVT